MSLWSLFQSHNGRVIHKWPHYFLAYERHLARFCNQSVTMLEIGCGAGGSLQLWKRYLGPTAQIVGIDINERCKVYEEPQIAVRIGDQSDLDFLASVVEEFGAFDIVLDDGSHVMEHIEASFRFLYPRLHRNAVYMVEDLHTAYMSRWGGGYKREGTFLETVKDLIDELHADYSRKPRGASDFSRSTLSMHIYDSLVVFERGRHVHKPSVRVGGRSGAAPVGDDLEGH